MWLEDMDDGLILAFPLGQPFRGESRTASGMGGTPTRMVGNTLNPMWKDAKVTVGRAPGGFGIARGHRSPQCR